MNLAILRFAKKENIICKKQMGNRKATPRNSIRSPKVFLNSLIDKVFPCLRPLVREKDLTWHHSKE